MLIFQRPKLSGVTLETQVWKLGRLMHQCFSQDLTLFCEADTTQLSSVFLTNPGSASAEALDVIAQKPSVSLKNSFPGTEGP